uniref:Uncharacterized protein n=1 Tax=Arundo donax TaxID=35708 RepID=A0A0A9E996_ARUDO
MILFDLPKQPITALESSRLATYNVPFHMIPTRQQDPTAAIKGFIKCVLRTSVKKPSSVAEKAFRTTSSDIVPFS